MTTHKKAQDISISTIIIAAIALIVLVVIILIFTGKINIFGQGLDDTTDKFDTENCIVPGAESVRECNSACPESKKIGSFGAYADCRGGYCCLK